MLVSQEAALRSVLIVDDDPIFVELATAVMQSIPMHVFRAEDGLTALTLLKGRAFDVALVDLDLPHIDGFRLIALARSMVTGRRMQIVVVTASKDPSDHHDALSAGADAIETKPVNWARLTSHIGP